MDEKDKCLFLHNFTVVKFIGIILSLSFPFFILGQVANSIVMEEAEKYSGGGYTWSSTGAYKNLMVGGEVFLEKSISGTYCSGFTFSVAFETVKRLSVLPDSISPNLKRFQRVWYGIPPESMERQCVLALEEMQWGCAKDLPEALPGDFIQFWRNNNSGHAVIFINWVKNEKEQIIGITYRSSQKQTNGIGARTETIGVGPKDININRIYIGRIEL